MQIGQTIINTPKDDPTMFDPEWRHSIAKAWAADPQMQWQSEYRDYKSDDWIKDHKVFLELMGKRAAGQNVAIPKSLEPHKLALTWYAANHPSATRLWIEPLLLTPVSFNVIAKDCGDEEHAPPASYKAYERLFFNIRKDDGTLSKACRLRTHFASPTSQPLTAASDQFTVARVCAANFGYLPLMFLWNWLEPNGVTEVFSSEYMSKEIWMLVQKLMLDRALRGTLGNDALIGISGIVEEHRKVSHIIHGGTDSQNTELTSILLGVLQQMGPQILTAARSVDDNKRLTDEITSRIISQQQSTGFAAKQNIVDIGEDRYKALVKSNFSRKDGGA